MSSIYIRCGMLWQQAEQGGPNVFLHIHVLQPLLGNPKAFLGLSLGLTPVGSLRKPFYRGIQETSLSDARTTTTECKCKGAVDVLILPHTWRCWPSCSLLPPGCAKILSVKFTNRISDETQPWQSTTPTENVLEFLPSRHFPSPARCTAGHGEKASPQIMCSLHGKTAINPPVSLQM